MTRLQLDRSRVATAWPRRSLLAALLSATLLSACADSPEQMLESARNYLASEDFSAAEIQLKNALQKDGSLAEARFMLGRLHLEQGELAGAVKELQRAADLDYAADEVLPRLARARLAAGEFDRVLEDFGKRELSRPSAQSELLTALAGARLAKGELKAASADYQQALVLDADNQAAGVGLARSRLFDNDLAGTEQALQAVLATHPENADAHALRSDLLQLQGNTEESLAALRTAVELAPANHSYRYALISSYYRLLRFEEGDLHLAELKKRAPGHAGTRYLLAYQDVREGRREAARDGLLAVLKDIPDYLPAHLMVGSVLLQLGQQAQGREHLEVVLARVPNQQLARSLLVASHLSSGEAGRAQELLEPLLEQGLEEPRLLGLAGQVFIANGDYTRAEDYLQRAAQAAPEDVEARLRLGAARLAAGDSEAALVDFGKASALDDSSVQAELARIATHLRRGETARALELQQALEARHGDDPQVLTFGGRLKLAQRDLPGARAAFEQALDKAPGFLAAALGLARLDVAQQQPAAALTRLQRFVERNDKSVEAYLALAELERETGAGSTQVLATLERARRAVSGSTIPPLAMIDYHLRLGESRPALDLAQQLAAAHGEDVRVLSALARAQLAGAQHEQAVATLNRVAQLRPESAAVLVQLADVHRAANQLGAAEQVLRRALVLKADALATQQRLAAVLRAQGRFDEALKVARTVQQQHPDSLAPHVLEAELQAAEGHWAEAVTAYQRALALKGGEEVLPRLHAALIRAERPGEAETLVKDWLAKRPTDLRVHGYLAERALAQGRLEEAAQGFRAMLALTPDSPLVLNNLAWTLHQLKDGEALALAERARDLAPGNAAILDTLGMIQVDQGAVEEGLDNLRKAVAIAPELPQLRLSQAQVYARLGRKEEARDMLTSLLPRLEAGSPLHKAASDLLATL